MATYSTKYLSPDLLRKRFTAKNGGYTYRTADKTYFVSALERDAFISQFEKIYGICGKLIMGWCAIGIVWFAALEVGLLRVTLPPFPMTSPGQTFFLILALPILYNWWAFEATGRALARGHTAIASIPDDANRLRKLQRITTVDFLLIAAVSCSVPTALADYFGVVPGSFTSNVMWGVPVAVILFAIGWSVTRWRVSRRVKKANAISAAAQEQKRKDAMPAYDIIIRNGTIVDGTGAPRFTADIAISGGLIDVVGKVDGDAFEEIDAAGMIVAPGWVDIHTHYDGQATWDQEMAPSSWHGVTTVVMGNCGVGFAPAAPNRHDWLIGLMEGVEDIPGTALAEGMKWDWETFPEYLDALERLPRTVDVAAHIPHGAVRAYVLGEREKPGAVPTADDIAKMSAIVEEALHAGALGFSTSRTVIHKSVDGEVVPGTTATAEELIAIGRAMGRAGFGVFELASDLRREWNEFEWMGSLSRETGLPVVFAALQSIAKELPLSDQIAEMERQNASGANIVAAIALRGNGIVMAWQGTVHPFRFRPSYVAIADLPWEEQLARIKDPAFKAQVLSEANVYPQSDIIGLFMMIAEGWHGQFEMDDDFDYEPGPEASIRARAAAAGKTPDEYAWDLLCENDGTGFIYLPILNYADGNLDFLEELQTRDDCVNSLSDGGAHCGTICDAASPTFMLQHWVRDRKRGAGRPGGRISLENAVKRQSRDTARLYGLDDRGVIAPGYLADINVIDFENLKLGKPWLAFDLPAGGKRLLQKAEGYVCTIKTGMVTFQNGKWTGETPGDLIRGPQQAELLEAAE